MAFSIGWCWFTALALCLQLMGGVAAQDCTEDNVQIEGGDYTLTNGLTSNSRLVYRCPDNYYPFPASVRLCLPGGTWKPTPTSRQVCKRVTCPDPSVLENGRVHPNAADYYVGSETTYACYSGYTLRGSASRVCQRNGKWNGTTPICSDDTGSDCPDPGVPAGARKVGLKYDIDDKVTYSCKNNLILVGSPERECQETGQWTGMEPACYYRHAYDTAEEVSEVFGNSIRQSLTEPQTDVIQLGKKIKITEKGTLNIYIAMDISSSIDEASFELAKRAVTQLVIKLSSFSINPNYDILFFSHNITEIVVINDFFTENKPTLKNVLEKLGQFHFGLREDLGTNLHLPFKRINERMALMKQNTKDKFVDHRHVIIFFTDGVYTMGGSPQSTVAQIKHRVYQNEHGQQDEKNRHDYLDIYMFGIGDKDKLADDELKHLTAPGAQWSRDQHYFRIGDMTELPQAFDKMIDEAEVIGLCGVHTLTTNKYPWRVDITIGDRKCVGSLVSSRFVLTAAHCFTSREEDVKVDTSDVLQMKIKVKNVTQHRLYNINGRNDKGVKEFYDYDVALVQLETKVNFSETVRPICIPCTKATSDALKLAGASSTCKQQEEQLLNTGNERLSFLSGLRGSVEEKVAYAKLGNHRGICISHARQAYGVTNVTAAVTDNFICTGGTVPNVDHIACKGDSGGAVFKEFEYRTIQVAVVSWGIHDMCKVRGTMATSNSTSRDFHINLFRMVPFLKSILANEDQHEYSPIVFLDN